MAHSDGPRPSARGTKKTGETPVPHFQPPLENGVIQQILTKDFREARPPVVQVFLDLLFAFFAPVSRFDTLVPRHWKAAWFGSAIESRTRFANFLTIYGEFIQAFEIKRNTLVNQEVFNDPT